MLLAIRATHQHQRAHTEIMIKPMTGAVRDWQKTLDIKLTRVYAQLLHHQDTIRKQEQGTSFEFVVGRQLAANSFETLLIQLGRRSFHRHCGITSSDGGGWQ